MAFVRRAQQSHIMLTLVNALNDQVDYSFLDHVPTKILTLKTSLFHVVN